MNSRARHFVTGLSSFGSSLLRSLAGSRFNPSRCWRAYIRGVDMELIADLKLIKPQFRHLYRDRIMSGSTGYALQALIEAWRKDHRRDKPPPCPKCGQLPR